MKVWKRHTFLTSLPGLVKFEMQEADKQLHELVQLISPSVYDLKLLPATVFICLET